MSRRVHIWRKWNGKGRWESWCGRLHREDTAAPTPTRSDPTGATCIQCLRAVRQMHLWRLKESGQAAWIANDLLEAEIRKR